MIEKNTAKYYVISAKTRAKVWLTHSYNLNLFSVFRNS